MNVFEMSTLLSPVGGAAGVGMAFIKTHHHGSSSSASLLVGIPLGLVFGFGISRGLMRLAILKVEDSQTLTSWRSLAILGAAMIAPFVSAFICFWVTILIYHVAA